VAAPVGPRFTGHSAIAVRALSRSLVIRRRPAGHRGSATTSSQARSP